MNRRINMQEASSSSRRSGLPHSMITSFTFGSSKPLVAQPEDPREGGRKLRPRSPVKVETAGKQTLKVEIEVEASSKRVKRGPKDEQKNLAEEVLPSLSDHLQDGIEGASRIAFVAFTVQLTNASLPASTYLQS